MTDEQRYAIKAEGQKPIFLPPGVEFGGVTRHAGEHSCEVGAPVTVHVVNPDRSLGPVMLTSRAHAWRPPRSFTDAQLIERDAAIEARVRAEVGARDERIKAAVSRMRGVLIANADRLDVPFTNEPSLSPWTRSVKPALEALLAAVAAGSSPDTTPEAS